MKLTLLAIVIGTLISGVSFSETNEKTAQLSLNDETPSKEFKVILTAPKQKAESPRTILIQYCGNVSPKLSVCTASIEGNKNTGYIVLTYKGSAPIYIRSSIGHAVEDSTTTFTGAGPGNEGEKNPLLVDTLYSLSVW